MRKRRLRNVEPVFTQLPGTPFDVAVRADGTQAFVSLPSTDESAIAVLDRAEEGWNLVRTFSLPQHAVPRGVVLDRSGRYLLVAAAAQLLVFDSRSAHADCELLLASQVPMPGCAVQLALTPDNRVAFVTDEEAATVAIVDLGESLTAETPTARLVGSVPLPPAPVGCAVSPDGQHLFVTSQTGGAASEEGALTVVDVPAALRDPARAVVTQTSGGSRPVRVAVAPSGETVWVTARGSNHLLGFDAVALVAAPENALRASVEVGPAPVGLVFARRGALLVVANSNRFRGGNRPQTLAVVDTDAALAGKDALLGTIPAGVFPRELTVLPDDETILATNFTSGTLETVSLARVGISTKGASDQGFSTSR